MMKNQKLAIIRYLNETAGSFREKMEIHSYDHTLFNKILSNSMRILFKVYFFFNIAMNFLISSIRSETKISWIVLFP